MNTNHVTYIRLTIPVLLLLLLAGCTTTNRLHDYDFDDARVAVVANIPPRPVVFTDVLYEGRIDPDDPIGSVFRVGSALIKHNEAREAQERMDQALEHVDVADRVAREALRRSAPLLGYRPVPSPHEADFILDIRIDNYGLVADSWTAAVHFEVDAEMVLVDKHTRQPIWRRHIREIEPISQAGVRLGATFGNTFTALALSQLSTDEMIVALEDLADFTAAHLTAALRRDFYASR